MLRAQEIQSTLEATFPSFAKALVRSNVHVGFWMHLPMQFCKSHLPRNDTTIFLENEIGKEFIINYIAERTALSGGWKAFCAGNKLREGDVLIFHLVQPLRFKVYIVKGNDSAKVDGDLGHLSLDAQQNQINNEDQTEEEIESCKAPMPLRVLPVNILQEKLGNQENSSMLLEANVEHAVDQSENENEVHVSKTLALTTSTGSIDDFKDMNGIKNFSIVVNGLGIDSELSDHHRTKYYELCCSQNSFLHKSILNSINHKLAAEIIIGTVNISEAIKASKLSTLRADYAVWDKTLKGFELLGMNVGFLRTRLERLMILAVESEEAMQTESREARHEQARVDEEMKNLELKLLKLRETRERLDTEIDALKESAESHEHKFQEVVNAPW
uniref:TF-B3 domain-containing protein n=1 Tax=Rhizophora mucronata TaxID=61149 RepID=A0A2P2QRH0_RHIMU